MTSKSDRSIIYWKNGNGEKVQVGRICGRENWTDADWDEDARRSKANAEAAEARKKALLARGWELHTARCSHDHGGEWAKDPLTGARVTHDSAYTLQQGRDPDSIPPWPKFDNDWKPPPSTAGLIHISEVKLQPMPMPMPMPSGLIFYQDYVYGADKPKK